MAKDDASKAPAKAAKKDLVKTEGDEGEATPHGWKRWVFGWVVVPGSLVGALFAGGALVGAHMSESWFTRSIVWVVDLF
jgi:hypothetical protein